MAGRLHRVGITVAATVFSISIGFPPIGYSVQAFEGGPATTRPGAAAPVHLVVGDNSMTFEG
jgi:hypothetical protein